jgi:hypothetical protein
MSHRLTLISSLCCTAAISLALTACATEPLPLEPEATADEGPAASTLEGPIVEVLRPTADGRAHYRFQFIAAEGMIAVLSETPYGYPEPVLPQECALDTFLRVAADDDLVPAELRRHCGDPSAEAGPRRTRELRKPGGEFQLQPVTDEPTIAAVPSLCTSSGYASRLDTLRDLAAYRAPKSQCTCNLGARWNLDGCAWIDGSGNILQQCSALDHQSFLMQAVSGFYCIPGETTCQAVPNPACGHNWTVFDDNNNGNWSAWQRPSVGADLNTRTRVDFASCTSASTTGFWKMRQQSTNAWGAEHPISVSGLNTATLTLSGPVSGGDYVGWDFFVRLDGASFQVASAWVYMEGIDASTCPMNL